MSMENYNALLAMRKRIKDLYVGPFTVSHGYIYDAKNEVVADFSGGSGTFRPRGYGRMKNMADGDNLHDCCEAMLLDLVKEDPSNQAKCIEILNKEWRE